MKMLVRFAGWVLFMALACGGCSGKPDPKKPVTSIQQLNDPAYTVSVTDSGAAFDAVKRDLPKAKRVYIEGQPAYDAVRMGKVDAYAFDRRQMEIAIAHGLKGVRLLDGHIGEGVDISIGLSRASKIDGLKGKINAFIAEMRASGILDDMFSRWVVINNHTMPDIDVPESSGLKLRVGTTGLVMPYSYYEGNTLTGYDVELARRFAKWLGAELEFRVYDYGGIIAAAATGEIDCIMANLNITPERAEKIDFADVLYTEEVAIMVKDDSPETPTAYSSVHDLDGKRIGVGTGTVHDGIIKEVLPQAEIAYFDSMANLVAALTSGKIDAIAQDDSTILDVERENSSLTHLDDYLSTYNNAFILPKTPEADRLRSELDEFIRSIKADGTLKKIREVWFGQDDSVKTLPDYANYPATNGTLKIALESDTPPFVYINDGKVVGYDVDVIMRFCKARGYRPEISDMNFPAIIPAVQSGKSDVGITAITITPERAESVNFTESVYTGGAMLLVRKSDTKPKSRGTYTTIADLRGKRIGVQTGVDEWAEIVHRLLPDAKVSYYNSLADLSAALVSRKIDAFPCDTPVLGLLMRENKNIAILDELLEESIDVAVGLPKTPKGEKLKAEWDSYINAIKANGELASLVEKWTGSGRLDETPPDYASLPATNGVLTMAAIAEDPPMSYYYGNSLTGFEVELAAEFCRAYGYGLEIKSMTYEAVLSAVQSGKCDFGLAMLASSEEHAENMLFSVPYYACATSMAVLKNDTDIAEVPASPSLPESPEPRARFMSIADLAGKRIGVTTGTTHPDIALKYVPTAELEYYDSAIDTLTALKAGKVDAVCTAIPILQFMMADDDSITMFGGQLTYTECAPIFPKTEAGKRLCDQFSEFARAKWKDGTIQELEAIWFAQDETRHVLKDYSSFPAPNGVLKMAADISVPPSVYVKDNKIVGYDVDFAVRFCEAYGYGLEIVPMNLTGIFPALQSGKCDFAMDSITITEERKEEVLFSHPNMITGNIFAVRKSDVLPKPEGAFEIAADLAGRRVGVQTGTANALVVERFIPTAKLEYFESVSDILAALRLGKIDASCLSLLVSRFMMLENDDIEFLGQPLTDIDVAPIFPKTDAGRKLCDEYSAFIKPLWDDGTLKALDAKWFSNDDSKRVMKDYSSLPSPNGVLKMAVDLSLVPFAYIKDNKIVGYDVELAAMFCEKYGYGLEIVPMSFGAIIPAIQSGKCDFASCTIAHTPERAESVLFSYPNTRSGNVLVVRKTETRPRVQARFTSIQDLGGKRIGAQTGTPNGDFALKAIPTAQIEYFDSFADIVTALKYEKIDAAALALNAARFMLIDNEDLVAMGKPLAELDAAPIFAKTEKGRKLCEQFNKFIKAQWDNGTLQELDSIWFGRDDSRRVPKDYSQLPAPNGVLRMGVDLSLAPFAYVKDNKIVGYEIDFAMKFCEENGYGLEVVPMNFGALIAAVQSGKCDFASCTIAITPERAEQVLFASPNAKTGSALVVRKADIQPPAAPTPRARFTSIDDLAGQRVGVQAGTRSPEVIKQFIPTAQLVYHDSPADNLIALRTGKIDAMSLPYSAAQLIVYEYDDLAFLAERITHVEMRTIFPKTEKGQKLCEEYSEFVKTLWDNGTIKEIEAVWMGKDESRKTIKDYTKIPATTPKGRLKMAVDTSLFPFVYVKDNKIVGYDMDIAVRFCEAKGYRLEVVPMVFMGIIPSVNTSKCDFSIALTYTPERAESVLFASTPNATTGTSIIVRKSDTQVQTVSDPIQHSNIDYLAGKRIGVQTATMNASIVAKNIPTAQIEYFDTLPDVLIALKTGKIDALCCSIFAARHMMLDNDDITYINQMLTDVDLAPIFTSSDKGLRLREEYSEFVKTLWADGTIREIDSLWLGKDEAKKTLDDYTSLPASNGTLRMAVDPAAIPFTYMKDGKVTGYDIDIAVRFCKAKGYGLEIVPMSFAAIIPAVQSGKCDFSSCMTYTPERAQSVIYSTTPNAKSGNVIVVMKAKTAPVHQEKPSAPEVKGQSQTSIFLDELMASINRTFIREDRWKLFVEGVINTMIITVLSILCGTALGFVVYLFCRGGNVIANLITRFFVWLIQGTPMVVLLMILYYIIFGKVDIQGIWVAVIAFSMTFGAGVYGMLRSGVNALDNGQTEAAYALGFSDRQTFFTVILPQAALHFMPAYKAEVVALIKATAIVGYIAVQDLTKMGDIVRSRTYEAFFPLIAVAIIYFVLAGMLNVIVGMIHNRIRPEKRTREDILRGVDSHD